MFHGYRIPMAMCFAFFYSGYSFAQTSAGQEIDAAMCADAQGKTFQLAVLGGRISIPANFVVLVSGSPVIELNTKFQPGCPSAFIRAGFIRDYKDQLLKEYSGREYTDAIAGNNFRIRQYTPPENVPMLAGVSTTLISNADQFLLVTTSDAKFWERLVSTFEIK